MTFLPLNRCRHTGPVNGPSTVIAPVKRKTAAGELWEEYAALGYLRKLHPLALWKDKVLQARRVKAKRIAEYLDRSVCLIGWPVTQKEVRTKDGLTMLVYGWVKDDHGTVTLEASKVTPL
jgi:hypothetical protein